MKKYNFLGLKCPIPVLKAHKILKTELNHNDFEFLSDDQSAPKDFKDLCSNMNNLYLNVVEEKKFYRIFIKRF